jgi:hypothetical protein
MYIHNLIPANRKIPHRKTVLPQEIPPFLFHTFLVKQKLEDIYRKMERYCQVTSSFQIAFYCLPELSNGLYNGIVIWRWVIQISI